MAPATPKDKSYEQLIETLKSHYQPKSLVIAERFRFYKRSQGPTESMAEFMACLRKLSSTCEFGTFLDQALRDRFVCGLLNDQAQKRLLTEAGLTAARALEIAQGIEAPTEIHGNGKAIRIFCPCIKIRALTAERVDTHPWSADIVSASVIRVGNWVIYLQCVRGIGKPGNLVTRVAGKWVQVLIMCTKRNHLNSLFLC